MAAPALAVPNDLAGAYAAHRDQLASASAAEELLQRVRSRTTPDPAQGAAGEGGTSAPISPATSVQQLPSGKPQGSALGRVAKDIGTGLVETPRALYTGARDAVVNTYNAIDDFSKWAGDKISDATGYRGIHVGKDGVHLETPAEAGTGMAGLITGGKGTDTDPADVLRTALDKKSIADPSSVTGGLVKGVTQFLTGLALTRGAGMPAKIEGVANYGYQALRGAAANFTAFDPHQQRLSNLIEQFPQLSNPVTQYLASKPADGAAEGRFKNSLEGLGLGVLTDGFFKGVKLLRNTLGAKETLGAVEAAGPAAEPAGLGPQAFEGLGDEHAAQGSPVLRQPTTPDAVIGDGEIPAAQPEQPAAASVGVGEDSGLAPAAGPVVGAESVAAGAAKDLTPEQLTGAAQDTAAPKTPQTYINFARIDAPEDIQRAIQELADAQAPSIMEAQRGTQTFEQTKLDASKLNAWKILSARRAGEPLNAEQSVAARELWASSASKLSDLAHAATDAPTEGNLFAFRKMLSVHNAIQQEVLGARTETARALSSWRIPVGTPESRLQDVAMRLQEIGGGVENVRDMARRVAGLADSGMDNELEAFVKKSAWVRTRNGLMQAWTDALLTAPTTQAKILASNASTALWRMGERGIASHISAFLGTEDGVAPGEMAAQWAGLTGGIRDALAFGWKAAKTGVTGAGIGEPHEPLPSHLSTDATGLDPDSWLGRGMDLLGTALSLPRRGIAAQHDVAQTLAYRMELNAQAVRQATSEMNAGGLTEEAYGARVADLIANPPENVQMGAVQGAKYQAFLDEPGALARRLLQMRQDVPAVRIILPFIKIPARIFSYAFERTPLAPLMNEFRANIAAGGARRDLALAQTGLGTSIMLAAADMTMSGRLKAQGPLEKGQQQAQVREGERNWSVLIGDKWVDVNGIHPFGKLLTLAASTTEVIMNGQHELKDDTDMERLGVAATLAFAGNLANTSYTQGASNFFAMLHDSRMGGSGEGALLSTAGSVIPAAVAAGARASDPYQRAVYGMLDEWKSRIPGLSKTLPPSRDLWGEPIPSQNGALESLVSPAQTRNVKHSPIDDEILKQGFNIPTPTRGQSFGSSPSARIDMSKYPEAYSRFLELAGHELKSPAWGVGAKELLNQVVSGTHPLSQVYQIKSDGPEGGKEVMVRDLLNQYREMAKRQLLEEYPKLKADVELKQDQQRQLKMPVLQ